MNPLFASAILGELNRPKVPTTLPVPDMRGAFGLSSDAFMQMYDAQARRGAAEAGLQAEAAQQHEAQRQFDIQARAARDKMLSDAWLGQERAGTDRFQAKTSRKGVKETKRSNRVKEGFTEEELGLAKEQFDWGKVMDVDKLEVDRAQSAALQDYYRSMSDVNRARISGETPLKSMSISEQRTANLMAEDWAYNELGIADRSAPVPQEQKAEFDRLKSVYLKHLGAPPMPKDVPGVDFDFTR